MRGETNATLNSPASLLNFNPLPSCEGRRFIRFYTSDESDFNPLPSCEGRRYAQNNVMYQYQFQSTPLMRGETHPNDWSQGESPISIHSPHARGDYYDALDAENAKISIHSPHARGDHLRGLVSGGTDNFNPLPSCEGRRSRCSAL